MRKVNLIPMAGEGKRFLDMGYKTPKPLIEVSGNKMIVSTAKSLPKTNESIFILHKNHIKDYSLDKIIVSIKQDVIKFKEFRKDYLIYKQKHKQ